MRTFQLISQAVDNSENVAKRLEIDFSKPTEHKYRRNPLRKLHNNYIDTMILQWFQNVHTNRIELRSGTENGNV